MLLLQNLGLHYHSKVLNTALLNRISEGMLTYYDFEVLNYSKTPVVSMFAATIGTPVQVLFECLNLNSRIKVTSDLETKVLRLGLISTSSNVNFKSCSIRIGTLPIERRALKTILIFYSTEYEATNLVASA